MRVNDRLPPKADVQKTESSRARSSRQSETALIQPWSAVNRPGGPDEQEADRVASQVMARLDRVDASPAHEQSRLWNGAAQTRTTPVQWLQRREVELSQAAERSAKISPEAQSDLQQAQGGGQSLAASVRSRMEQSFGADFSGVRVHTDQRAHKLNESFLARAFTTGQDIFFKKGEFDPSSRQGTSLLAHELAHVTQQRPELSTLRAQTSHGGAPLVQRMPDEDFDKALARVLSNINRFWKYAHKIYLKRQGVQFEEPKTLRAVLANRGKHCKHFNSESEIFGELLAIVKEGISPIKKMNAQPSDPKNEQSNVAQETRNIEEKENISSVKQESALTSNPKIEQPTLAEYNKELGLDSNLEANDEEMPDAFREDFIELLEPLNLAISLRLQQNGHNDINERHYRALCLKEIIDVTPFDLRRLYEYANLMANACSIGGLGVSSFIMRIWKAIESFFKYPSSKPLRELISCLEAFLLRLNEANGQGR